MPAWSFMVSPRVLTFARRLAVVLQLTYSRGRGYRQPWGRPRGEAIRVGDEADDRERRAANHVEQCQDIHRPGSQTAYGVGPGGDQQTSATGSDHPVRPDRGGAGAGGPPGDRRNRARAGV